MNAAATQDLASKLAAHQEKQKKLAERFLIGQDPMNIGALWQEMYRSNYFEGGRVLTAYRDLRTHGVADMDAFRATLGAAGVTPEEARQMLGGNAARL